MSQSAVSDALSRLRQIFDDQLLVPTKKGFVLSNRAKELMPLLDKGLERIEVMLDATPLDPANAKGRFHIAASDYVTLIIGPPLMRVIREAAPGLHIQFHDPDEEAMDALSAGHLDVILLPQEELANAPSDVSKEFVFQDDLALIARNNADSDFDIADRDMLDLFENRFPFQPVVRQYGDKDHREIAIVPTFMLLPFVVSKTDVVAQTPRRLAELLSPAADGLRIAPQSSHMPKMRICLAWQRSRNNDPLHKWLRDQIIDIGCKLNQGR
jgi:DNA-binding transcriptional LysR family regulator